jgi:transposase
MRTLPPLTLTDEEKQTLEKIVRRSTSTQAEARRARVILACAQGLTNKAVAELVGASQPTVGTWRKRFLEERIEGLADLPRSGPPRKIDDEKVAEVIRLTLETKPENATHWSTRKWRPRWASPTSAWP